MSALPGELKRNFQLMRELDTRTQENLEEIEQLQRLYSTLARKNGKAQDDDEASSLVERIRHQFQECTDVADEKVRVSFCLIEPSGESLHTLTFLPMRSDCVSSCFSRPSCSVLLSGYPSILILIRFPWRYKPMNWSINTSGDWYVSFDTCLLPANVAPDLLCRIPI